MEPPRSDHQSCQSVPNDADAVMGSTQVVSSAPEPPAVTTLTLATALLGLAFLTTASPTPAKSSCSARCDERASACDDACEARHKEPKLRIECKLACISERADCEKGCN